MTKDEILDALENERENLLEAIDGMTPEEMEQPGPGDEWSVKDILIHLSAWEAELVKLLWQAKQGQRPSTVHFSNIDVDTLNREWYLAYKDRPLERVLPDFEAVRKQTIRRVESFSDKDLNDEQRFPWLEGTPLWEWIANDSYGHEAEHAAQILARKHPSHR
jgi:hypothetical protein